MSTALLERPVTRNPSVRTSAFEQPQAGNAVTPPAARDLGMAVAEALNGIELERAA
jgi:hypothetical protein